MMAIDQFATAAESLGYRPEAIVRNFSFADVLTQGDVTRSVPLVAFTRTPPSYRSAALAVVVENDFRGIETVNKYRALGAPLLFVIEAEEVTIWQVRSQDPPRAIERVRLEDVSALFSRNSREWHPDAIHRAKSIGVSSLEYQLDFVDLGLMPAIEGEVHLKLDRLLVDSLDLVRNAPNGKGVDERVLFRVVFRLLAAKVLEDRGHPYSKKWDSQDLASVLREIEGFYNLGQIDYGGQNCITQLFHAVWNKLRSGISFSNISSEDLAFVYENSLITPETRKLFGTHSTPRQVAEYVVQRLNLQSMNAEDVRIYEPFAGAGVFLVSALRHLRDLLPVEWSDQKRHDFLIERISGDEIDPFACEVATLSLILADYPNHNGWHVTEADLFADGVLASRLADKNVIICNPPFEAFTPEDKSKYELATQTHSKAIAALGAALDAKPLALGFVLPHSFILEKQFSELRRRIEQLYGQVEILKLPDAIFGASGIESSAVIASDLRAASDTRITIRSTEVAERDRLRFLKTGHVTVQREEVRSFSETAYGDLWLRPLGEVWEYLQSSPMLGSMLQTKRGLEWRYPQKQAQSDTKKPGYREGYANATNLKQYQAPRKVWLDFKRENLRCGASHDWSGEKIIASATRLNRGAWCIGAFVDHDRRLCSQQFFAMRPKNGIAKKELLALCAVVNGPIANAFLAINSPKDRFRTAVIDRIPLPRSFPARLAELVDEYDTCLNSLELLTDRDSRLAELLIEIDAAVLGAYDLPLRLERQILEFFEAAKRPTSNDWVHWDKAISGPGLSLSERVTGRFNVGPNWVDDVFKPLPEDEIRRLRNYMAE